ncbi:MAG: hypothetical protein JWN78_1509 [Bacteroidota bacterium]|nr:hypothetical protein [Bacteroidota bacterium]
MISKYLYALAFLFFCSIPKEGRSSAIKLNEAIKNKKISCYIHGNGASTHYLEPVIAEFTNTGSDPLELTVEDGDMFIPADSTRQNIVVTGSAIITLQPHQKKTVAFKGMCTEQQDRSGDDETVYTFKPVNNEKLRKLADFISEKKYQTTAAQYAVWSLMNNDDLNSIYSADTTEENDLRKFMAALTGKTFVLKKDYRYNYYEPPKEKVGGNFEYNFSKPQDVQIAMFDKNGILVRELFNRKKVPAGMHTTKFEFDSAVYTDDVYYFKLIAMNGVLVNQKVDVRSIREEFRKKIENRN